MEIEDSKRGLGRSCSQCHKGLASNIKVFFFGVSLEIYCPHCRSCEGISIGFKPKVTVASIAVLFLIIASFYSYGKIIAEKKITCSAFNTQEEAQLTFNTNPIKYRNLDADNDLRACQNLKHSNILENY